MSLSVFRVGHLRTAPRTAPHTAPLPDARETASQPDRGKKFKVSAGVRIFLDNSLLDTRIETALSFPLRHDLHTRHTQSVHRISSSVLVLDRGAKMTPKRALQNSNNPLLFWSDTRTLIPYIVFL